MALLEGQARIPAGCAISGIINTDRKRISGDDIIKSIAIMHNRSNGLGGGFAAYGIYPEYKDFYALHIFYDNLSVKMHVEEFIDKHFEVESSGNIPTRPVKAIVNRPMVWRYFVTPRIYLERAQELELDEDEYTAQCIIKINKEFNGAYVFSSGKNMGAFKGVGYPEDIGEFFMLDTYKAYTWTAHGRFPTNTPGWWGGAHPFTMLDWSVVHNGEISSYDANRRFVEMFGYHCSLQTDTEVMTYLFDLLVRKHKIPLEKATEITCAPFWDEIDRQPPEIKKELTNMRAVYSSALINGPFSILLGFSNGLIALNDRIKLRSMVAGIKGKSVYVASEESAIRVICPDVQKTWSVPGGKPLMMFLDEEA
jgi:glutamate synthase domain-containing protein 1